MRTSMNTPKSITTSIIMSIAMTAMTMAADAPAVVAMTTIMTTAVPAVMTMAIVAPAVMRTGNMPERRCC